jgi:hypothetical protein
MLYLTYKLPKEKMRPAGLWAIFVSQDSMYLVNHFLTSHLSFSIGNMAAQAEERDMRSKKCVNNQIPKFL